jgi:hypothetical protein
VRCRRNANAPAIVSDPTPREPAPIENVTTKNGSVYHGEIIEKVVRDHVTIKLATDEIKTIVGSVTANPWNDNTGLNVATVSVNVIGGASLLVGLALIASAQSAAIVNGVKQ